jgi:hypothetical protein
MGGTNATRRRQRDLAGTNATSPAAGGVRGVSPRQPSCGPLSPQMGKSERSPLVALALALGRSRVNFNSPHLLLKLDLL